MGDLKGKFFTGLTDLKEYLRTNVTKIKGDQRYVPFLQSDYSLIIYEDSNITNAADYMPVLIQSLDLSPLRNGFTSQMDSWGLQSVNFSASNMLTFSYLGMSYQYPGTDSYFQGVYSSYIHYLYATRITAEGTLKIKQKGDKKPAVMIVNTKSNNIIYALYNCTFSYPIFEASPQSNSISFYKTTVAYSSYKEFLGDDVTKLFTGGGAEGLISNVNKFA